MEFGCVMPRWLGRILWALRGKRRVTMQLDSRTPGVEGVTLQGVLVGRWAGHYVLELPKLVAAADATHALGGRFVEVPRERVIFFEVES